MSALPVTAARPAESVRSVSQVMFLVMLALLPGTLIQAWLIDWQLIRLLAVGIVAAVSFEALALRLRGRAIRDRLADGSIVVAAWLLVLCLPPGLPLWQLLIGMFVMVTLGKHLYGGLGHNPFNPAMVAYAVLLISFPASMTDWPDTLARQTGESTITAWDSVSGATPLDTLRQYRLQQASPPAVTQGNGDGDGDGDGLAESRTADTDPLDFSYLARSLIFGADWLKVNLAFLCGGLFLLWRGIIAWPIPVAVIGGFLFGAILLRGIGLPHALPVLPALFSGAVLLGAFFIATDPVTAATSRTGRLVYGMGIGLLCVLIRQFSSYPEGLAFAVLLMNTTVPLLDHLLTGPAGGDRLHR